VTNVLVILIIGFVVGWLYSVLVKTRGFGVTSDIIIGVTGAVMGGFTSSSFGGSRTVVADLGAAVIGALVLLGVFSIIVYWMRARL